MYCASTLPRSRRDARIIACRLSRNGLGLVVRSFMRSMNLASLPWLPPLMSLTLRMRAPPPPLLGFAASFFLASFAGSGLMIELKLQSRCRRNVGRVYISCLKAPRRALPHHQLGLSTHKNTMNAMKAASHAFVTATTPRGFSTTWPAKGAGHEGESSAEMIPVLRAISDAAAKAAYTNGAMQEEQDTCHAGAPLHSAITDTDRPCTKSFCLQGSPPLI